MRVLFISHEDSKFGAPKSLMELMKTLKEVHGVEPVVLLHSQDDVYDFCEKENIEKYVVGHRNFVCGRKNQLSSYCKLLPKYVVNRYDDIRALKRVEKLIEMKSIDIIHSNVSIISLGMLLHQKYEVPHIVHLREAASFIEDFILARRHYIDYMNKNSDLFIAISNYNKNEWCKFGLSQDKVRVVYNGLKLQNVECIKKQVDADCVRIVFSGAISEEKGQMTLIEAINLVPNEIKDKIHVDIMGTGNQEYVKKLSKKIRDDGLAQKVHLLGYVEKAVSRFHEYDIGIVASRGEAFGRVTVEYMSKALCVIASDAGANPELIQDGQNGLLFRVNDAKDLAEKLTYAVIHKEFRRKVAETAQKSAFEFYTTNINAKNVYQVYLETLNR